ncbi:MULTISPECIES: CYTH and CHAD domain-containing protein [unclassified Brevundimonas]|uniref:CYTH and CHAD domain-containing protein n=1 Tax=unclassified Brevundimonas TaxID=2622653 RepID=UPI000CFC43B1|nr:MULTISPECIES: CYTH and CHAD domain-containing protein [unclassified Brevundimonas]PRA27746.1 inorganic triphosphatase [Brevundimonas sp. MYb27]PQZ81093.1 inorganic triphosphatase [Brevundimonas sp. MYb31]PRB15340.1 inorganic triphosphatase [Brevundimonas sp. MYb52]PRB35737.1 inorganic triphosphatase [Brevundimonas sp. MYb46]PRB44678.1 inorganic triphosphatase [Brevundimonas sp. MYb33]
MASPATETELKFRLGPGAVVRLSGHPALQGPQTTQSLRSVYFDTPDGVLRAAGCSLRVRTTPDGFVQTLKRQTAPGQTARDEWEVPVASEALDLVALKATPAHWLLKGRRRDLSPRFASTVVRRIRMVEWDGARIEVAFDAGELSAGEKREPIYELELELKAGDPAALFALARRLARDLAIVPVFESKSERGWRLASGDSRKPRAAAPTPLSPEATTGEAFRLISMACLAQVSANAELLRVVRRPEAVHQMRVGLRRLRAAVGVFKPLLAAPERQRIETELKWLARESDAARDLDVFIRDVFHPTALEASSPGLAALGRHLLTARGQAYDRVLTAISSPRYALLMLETTAWIETAALPDAPVAPFAAEALTRLHHQVETRARDLSDLDAEARHHLRIRTKRLRYAAEFFADLFPARRRRARYLKALERLQDRLGALNDLAVARDRIPGEAHLDDPEVAFSAGRVIGRRERDEAALLTAAVKVWGRFHDARPFWIGRKSRQKRS